MFLAKITDFLLTIPPWTVVFPDEHGIFIRGGKYTRTLLPGFYFKYPVYDTIRKMNVKEQIIDLPSQSVTNRLGKILALSGTIRYQVYDAKKAMLDVLDYDESIQNLAMSLIAEFVSQTERCKHQDICESVLSDLNAAADRWGIEVLDFWLTDYAEHKVYRIMGDMGSNTVMIDE